jgi:hypothetical protein
MFWLCFAAKLLCGQGNLELPTKAVDNSVDNPFLIVLTAGFYYSFVTLPSFETACYFHYESIS